MEYIVKTPIRCNGKRYEKGESVELVEAQAKELLNLNLILGISKAKGGNPPPPAVPPKYSDMSNKEQIAYFETIEDQAILESLVETSKATAKKVLEKKIRELT